MEGEGAGSSFREAVLRSGLFRISATWVDQADFIQPGNLCTRAGDRCGLCTRALPEAQNAQLKKIVKTPPKNSKKNTHKKISTIFLILNKKITPSDSTKSAIINMDQRG